MESGGWFIVFLVLTAKVQHSHAQQQQTNYIRPLHGNTTCPGDPCLTLEAYAQDSDTYFTSDTDFVFISGDHHLNVSVRLKGVSNMHFQGERNDYYSQNPLPTQILFRPLTNIILISCYNITFSHLSFSLGGALKIFNPNKIFPTLGIWRSNVFLSHLHFHNSRRKLYSTALVSFFSEIEINDMHIEGAESTFGAALKIQNSIVNISGNNTFSKNRAWIGGGALFSEDSDITISGFNRFDGNSAKYKGGAVCVLNTNITFSGGEAHFVHNRATYFGGAIAVIHDSQVTTRNGTFFYLTENLAGVVGGAMLVNNSKALLMGRMVVRGNKVNAGAIGVTSSSIVIASKVYFVNNFAFVGGAISIERSKIILTEAMFKENTARLWGGAMNILYDCHVIIENTSMIGNTVEGVGGAIYVTGGYLHLRGVNHFENNIGRDGGGGLSVLNVSQLKFTGKNYFLNNTSEGLGGGMYVSITNIFIQGVLNFVNNYSPQGGAVHGALAQMDFDPSSDVTFVGNKAMDDGGAVCISDTLWNVKGTVTFNHNSATTGGAMSLSGTSKLTLNANSTITYSNNHATKNGGALYFSGTLSINQCHPNTDRDALCYLPNSATTQLCKRLSECFFELNYDEPFNTPSSNKSLFFFANSAEHSGDVIFGGSLDNCRLYLGGGFEDDCGNKIGREYTDDALQTFLAISRIDNISSDISSEPFRVCFCNKYQHPDCAMNTKVSIVRGRQFTLSAVTVGQGNYTVPSSIKADFSCNTDAKMNQLQRVQNTGIICTDISYRVFSEKSSVTLILFPDGPCRDTGISRREVEVEFLPCPDGFEEIGSECVCDKRLEAFNTTCNIDRGTISRAKNTFWLTGLYDNSSYRGLLLHQVGCPLDFCMNTALEIHLNDTDMQCNHNHSGIVCGSCRENFSIALGTLHCLPCNNAYILLVLPFALAGIILVAVLLLLQMTVALGTMNGLIFYANVVQVNRDIFFPPGTTNILTVFIAWLNLDLGIETCFYDGMDAYAFVWLQFLFPFFVWFLMGFTIFLCRHSRTIAKSLGSNPISVLATLSLLSYSKILQAIILALSCTSIQYPDGSSLYVWLYDGNVPYFQRADHIVLGVFAILVFFLLFLPYTFLLLCGAKIQAYSHWRVFSWINKIKPFMDAYYAPYKKETRYWTGFLLLVRCVLFLTFDFNALGNSSINLMTITSVTVALMAFAWLQNRLYERIHNDVLEAFFILNLCILAAATYHVKETNGSQHSLAYTSVGLSFAIFIGIVCYHVYLRVQKKLVCCSKPQKIDYRQFITKVLSRNKETVDDENKAAFKQVDTGLPSVDDMKVPTTITIDLNEPLLVY